MSDVLFWHSNLSGAARRPAGSDGDADLYQDDRLRSECNIFETHLKRGDPHTISYWTAISSLVVSRSRTKRRF
jgi:hypothetical protein